MREKIIGVVLLALVLGGGTWWWFSQQAPGSAAPVGLFGRETVAISGLIGSEKSLMMENPEVLKVLQGKYGLETTFKREGSVEQVRPEKIGDSDFLWPSSQVSLELFKAWNPERKHKAAVVLNTPLVIFSWDKVTDALINAKIVKETAGSYYVVDLPGLLELVLGNKTWKEIGLPQLFGKVNLIPTDPTKSNSGNLFAGLMANVLVNDVTQEKDLEKLLPILKSFFARQGFMESSTGFLFEQFLNKGMGSYPLIVGYENQIVEFSLQNPQIWEKVRGRLRILYPVPTVWSSHTLISLDGRADMLITAWEDPELQKLAWEKHGFRTGVVGVENNPQVLAVAGIPQDVTQTIPLPSGAVMTKLTEALQNLNEESDKGDPQ